MLSAAELAVLCDAEVLGFAGRPIAAVAPINLARPCDLAWIGDSAHLDDAVSSQAGALIVPRGANAEHAGVTLLVSSDPVSALKLVIEALERQSLTVGSFPEGGGLVDSTVQLGADVHISPNVVIGPGTVVGAGTWIGPNVVIESGVELGDGCHVGAGSLIGGGTRVGHRCRIGAGSLLGTRPDAYHWDEGGMKPVPAFGVVILSDYVDLGPGTQVQRAVEGSTVVGDHTMIGSQCLIGHDCRIGMHTMIGGQSGLGASCEVGDHVVISVQVGVNVGIHVGDRARIGARSGVLRNVPAGETWLGTPAAPKLVALRQLAALRRLASRQADGQTFSSQK